MSSPIHRLYYLCPQVALTKFKEAQLRENYSPQHGVRLNLLFLGVVFYQWNVALLGSTMKKLHPIHILNPKP